MIWIQYLPIATTLIAAAFLADLLRRSRSKGWPAHLTWWAIGVACYGLGTLLESTITLAGNGPWLNRFWYCFGAVLGAYPLATGTVYLLCRRRHAHALTITTVPLVVLASAAVLLSPVEANVTGTAQPAGHHLAWGWVRLLTPAINGYAAAFLIGGAAWSALRFARQAGGGNRAGGTALIALGALLPAVGGAIARGGTLEPLYAGELVGLALIWAGYRLCQRPADTPAVASHDVGS